MDKRPRITRDVFLNALVCPRLGWFIRTGSYERGNALSERVHLEQQRELKRRIQSQFPDGICVSEEDFERGCAETQALLSDKGVKAIFNGAFEINGYCVRADIIIRKGRSWHLYEIKSAIQVAQKHLDDIGYTTMIMELAGLPVSSASLILLSADYRLGMDDKHLFKMVVCTRKAHSLARAFQVFMEPIDSLTCGSNQPKVDLIFECRDCAILPQCIDTKHEGHILELPRLTEPKFRHLSRLRVRYMFDIPEEFPLTKRQQVALRCMETGHPFIGNHLGEALASISFPSYYLDFEPVITPIPLYGSVAPFEKVPIAYSIHNCKSIGVVTDHSEYLANLNRDCREEFAEKLISDLGVKGTIVVYEGRERDMIASLARAFPNHSQQLNSVLDRLVDLEDIMSREFYHPDFKGNTSIEQIAAVLTGESLLSRTEINAEDDAGAAFASMGFKGMKADELIAIRDKLSDYCRMKTLSMVQIHTSLQEYAP